MQEVCLTEKESQTKQSVMGYWLHRWSAYSKEQILKKSYVQYQD